MQSMPETFPELIKYYEGTLKTLENEGFHLAQTIPTVALTLMRTVSIEWWTVSRNPSKHCEMSKTSVPAKPGKIRALR